MGAVVGAAPAGTAAPPGPCAKQVVTATLITPAGHRYVGTNACDAPQAACPRDAAGWARGAGYHLCREVCRQPGHAEVMAIDQAGDAAAAGGGTIYLEGHTAPCAGCQAVVDRLGISVVVGPPPASLRCSEST